GGNLFTQLLEHGRAPGRGKLSNDLESGWSDAAGAGQRPVLERVAKLTRNAGKGAGSRPERSNSERIVSPELHEPGDFLQDLSNRLLIHGLHSGRLSGVAYAPSQLEQLLTAEDLAQAGCIASAKGGCKERRAVRPKQVGRTGSDRFHNGETHSVRVQAEDGKHAKEAVRSDMGKPAVEWFVGLLLHRASPDLPLRD